MNPIFNLSFVVLMLGMAGVEWPTWKSSKPGERFLIGGMWIITLIFFIPVWLGKTPPSPIHLFTEFISPIADHFMEE